MYPQWETKVISGISHLCMVISNIYYLNLIEIRRNNEAHLWPTTTVNVCVSRTPVLAKFTSKWLQTQRRECNLLYELSDIDETLAQDQIDDIEEEEKDYLRKIYNAYYIQMEACCTVILGSFSNNIGIIQTRFTPFH